MDFIQPRNGVFKSTPIVTLLDEVQKEFDSIEVNDQIRSLCKGILLDEQDKYLKEDEKIRLELEKIKTIHIKKSVEILNGVINLYNRMIDCIRYAYEEETIAKIVIESLNHNDNIKPSIENWRNSNPYITHMIDYVTSDLIQKGFPCEFSISDWSENINCDYDYPPYYGGSKLIITCNFTDQ